jgi:hypothetical protein
MRPDVTLAISVAVTVTVLCIAALRVIDVNEKEPLWALALLVWLGVVAAGVTALAFDPTDSVLRAALLAEGAKAVAIVTGLSALGWIGRRRGTSELNSVLDWLIYGAAAGVGFAIGDGFLRATFTAGTELQSPDPRNTVELLWMTVQSCLTEAAFGALFGAALGAAARVRRVPARAAFVAGGFGLAVAGRGLYVAVVLQDGVHAPGFSVAGAVAVTAIVLLALSGLRNALGAELQVITEELAAEDEQTVKPEEREPLSNPWQRFRDRVDLLARGGVEQWVRDRRIHDHQVALAFARREHGPTSGEAERRRAAIAAARTRGLMPAWPGPAVALAIGLVILAGALVIWRASGGQAPSTFATRTSLAERELTRMRGHERPGQPLRVEILLVPARWRLTAPTEDAGLVAEGAREAYRLEYRSSDGAIRYRLARYGSEGAARKAARRLAAERDAEAWADKEVVAQVHGSAEARAAFCGALTTPETCRP